MVMMNMWALIENSTVAEITSENPNGRFHPTMSWVPCSSEVKVGWRCIENSFLPPAVPIEGIHFHHTVAINRACEAAITAGFTSDALGTPHRYTSQLDDQLNLTGAVLRGVDMPYACRDEQSVKEFRLHTAEQLRQVGDDFTMYKLQLLQRANELKQQLNAALEAGDLAAIEAITWEASQS